MTGILTGNLLEIVFDAFALLLVDLGLQSLGAPLLLVCRVLGQSSLQFPSLANPSQRGSHALLDRVSLRDGSKASRTKAAAPALLAGFPWSRAALLLGLPPSVPTTRDSGVYVCLLLALPGTDDFCCAGGAELRGRPGL